MPDARLEKLRRFSSLDTATINGSNPLMLVGDGSCSADNYTTTMIGDSILKGENRDSSKEGIVSLSDHPAEQRLSNRRQEGARQRASAAIFIVPYDSAIRIDFIKRQRAYPATRIWASQRQN
jgi:hypothetical protein